MERMIRVDLAKPSDDHSVGIDNPKLSVFVGNLDFGCKEEDLRVFVEGVVSGERGPPGVHDGEDDDIERTSWVTRVRVVRDKETQLGKGFAYVQFSVCVFLQLNRDLSLNSLHSGSRMCR